MRIFLFSFLLLLASVNISNARIIPPEKVEEVCKIIYNLSTPLKIKERQECKKGSPPKYCQYILPGSLNRFNGDVTLTGKCVSMLYIQTPPLKIIPKNSTETMPCKIKKTEPKNTQTENIQIQQDKTQDANPNNTNDNLYRNRP